MRVKAHRKNREEQSPNKKSSAKVAPGGGEAGAEAGAEADAKANDGQGPDAKPAEPDGDLMRAEEGGANAAPRAEGKGTALEVQDVPSDLDSPKGEEDEVKS